MSSQEHSVGNPTRLLLFAGFLGSGKTTLILSFARQAAAVGSRMCVIVNEVGEVGIDGETLRMGDLEVREITAGCICCQIGVDLVRTLVELDELYGPDVVIVEASGVATPPGVLEALHYYPGREALDVQTVTVVDPTRFAALLEVLTPLIESQIASADRVVLTKVDEATTAEITSAEKVIRGLAPSASVYVVDARRQEMLGPLFADLLATSDPGEVLASDLDEMPAPAGGFS